MSFKYKIPQLLIYSRLLLAWSIFVIGLTEPVQASTVLIVLLIIGLLTDIFDGIIARYLNISTTHLRQLDTRVDRVFWLSALFALVMMHPVFFVSHGIGIGVLLALELAAWVIGKIKFRQGISFHSILSKFWAISILVTMIDAFSDGAASISFAITFWYGLIAQLDIILIAFMLPEFQCDIPSSWHAFRIRRGRTIRRMKLFNG
ncbi:MAG: CDP-alcohol phosphatidyltransferase [Bacteroidetes bacterium]|jgi:CDP-diacylglycerol--glycerol-3-phosphate 3-phosphatidyltransferase|nr:CDP-alcohol phosphatidyltransferase [Bacteroidota bacterium]